MNASNEGGFSRRQVQRAFLFGVTLGLTLSSLFLSFFMTNNTDNNIYYVEHGANASSSVRMMVEKEEHSFLPPLREQVDHSMTVSASTQSYNLTRDDLFKSNHFFRAWQGVDFPRAKDLAPFRVLTTYIQQHSRQQLQNEWSSCQKLAQQKSSNNNNNDNILFFHHQQCNHLLKKRQFVVGVYSCPLEAGNRIHRFVNGLLWAILTNRTYLVRYHTMEVCQDYERAYPNEDCGTKLSNMSSPSDCDYILHLSPWIPMYDDWKDALQLTNQPIVRAEIRKSNRETTFDSTTLPFDSDCSPKIIRPGKQVIINPAEILSESTRMMSNSQNAKRDITASTSHLIQPNNLERLQQLESLGAYFAYGMMQEALFTLDPSLLPTNEKDSDKKQAAMQQKSFFLHSRHPYPKDKGEYIHPEYLCLTKLAQNDTAHTPSEQYSPSSCVIYLLSDRQATLKLLEESIRNATNCQVQTTQNRAAGQSFFSVEHGPFAGRGFWQDIAMASQARHGMIAFHKKMGRAYVRTSSSLIRERVEFRRVLEWTEGGKRQGQSTADLFGGGYHDDNTTVTIPPFWECTNPWKNK